MDARDPIFRAIQLWTDKEIDLLPPGAEEEVEAFFRTKLGFPLSRDVLTLYSMVGGFADGQYDWGFGWSLWPLERILEENRHNTSPNLWFADGDLSAHFYSLDWISPDVSAVWIDDGSRQAPQVAESVAEFFGKYVNDPPSVDIFYPREKSHVPTSWWERLWAW